MSKFNEKSCMRKTNDFTCLGKPITATNCPNTEENEYNQNEKKVSFCSKVTFLESTIDLKKKNEELKRRLWEEGDNLKSTFHRMELDQLNNPINPTKKSITKNEESLNEPDLYIQTDDRIVIGKIIENDYVRFVPTFERNYHQSGAEKQELSSVGPSNKLLKILEELETSHSKFSELDHSKEKENFLINNIFKKHILALELSLTEGLIDIGRQIVTTVYQILKFIIDSRNWDSAFTKIKLFESISNEDLVDIKENISAPYIKKVEPILRSLNALSGTKQRTDNSHFSLETLCMKFQLELMCLTILPLNSILFSTILRVLLSTSVAAMQMLDKSIIYNNKRNRTISINWVNNSTLRFDYFNFLHDYGFMDCFYGSKCKLI